MRDVSIRTRLGLALGLILTTAIVGISLVNYQVSREASRREMMNSALPLTRDTIYSEIQAALFKPIFVSSLMSNDTFLKDWVIAGERDQAAIVKYLKEIRDRYEYFSTFFVSAVTGRYYHYNGVLKTLSRDDAHDIWYYDFIGLGQGHELVVDTDEASQGVLTVFVNFRLEDYQGRLLGVTGVGIKVSLISELLERTRLKYGKTVYLMDRFGNVKVHSDRERFKGGARPAPAPAEVVQGILAGKGEPTLFEYDADGHYLVTARFVPEVNWFLVVEEGEGHALAAARRNLATTLVLGLLASAVVLAVSLTAVNRYQRRLEQQAVTDDLTGLPNRRAFAEQFRLAAYMHGRENRPVSVILFDVDGLKAVNDAHGHQVGDLVLQEVARASRGALRACDLLARWGGDEFIILSPSDEKSAAGMAERVRDAVRVAMRVAHPRLAESALTVSVSLGVAGFGPGDTMDSLVARADKAMYLAKHQGRDRVAGA